MKYGVEYENSDIKCANCKQVVATNGDLEKNYCEKCGAPLSALAIADFEEMKESVRKNLLLSMKDIAVSNHTDSFLEILKQLKQDE